MTTYLVCDNCGIQSCRDFTHGWLVGDNDQHLCIQCRAKAMLKRANEPNPFAGLPDRLQPRGGTIAALAIAIISGGVCGLIARIII